ncbi:MAG: hypothetical protein WC139_07535 [Candidatus Kapaibacterium sp.]
MDNNEGTRNGANGSATEAQVGAETYLKHTRSIRERARKQFKIAFFRRVSGETQHYFKSVFHFGCLLN